MLIFLACGIRLCASLFCETVNPPGSVWTVNTCLNAKSLLKMTVNGDVQIIPLPHYIASLQPTCTVFLLCILYLTVPFKIQNTIIRLHVKYKYRIQCYCISSTKYITSVYFFKYVFQMHVFTILHSTLHVYFMQAVYLQLFWVILCHTGKIL